VVGRFPNETSALVMVFSLLEEERVKWQKVGMRAEDIAWIEEASKALGQEPIKLARSNFHQLWDAASREDCCLLS